MQRLEKYSGSHVHSRIKRAVKAPIESSQRSIKVFINYSSPFSFLSVLNLLTFSAASLTLKGYFSAGASDFHNCSDCLDLDCLFYARSWHITRNHKEHRLYFPQSVPPSCPLPQWWKVTKCIGSIVTTLKYNLYSILPLSFSSFCSTTYQMKMFFLILCIHLIDTVAGHVKIVHVQICEAGSCFSLKMIYSMHLTTLQIYF